MLVKRLKKIQKSYEQKYKGIEVEEKYIDKDGKERTLTVTEAPRGIFYKAATEELNNPSSESRKILFEGVRRGVIMMKDYAANGRWILKENEDSPFRAADIIDWLEPAIRAGQIKANGKELLWRDIGGKAKTDALFEDEAESGASQNTADNKGMSEIPVEHDGEYVLTTAGSRDFGEIGADTGLTVGKIRLRKGMHDEKTHKGYGEAHIERPDRMAELKQNGYERARDLVEYAAKDYDAIYAGKGNGFVVAKEKDNDHNSIVFVELKTSDDGKFYDVGSGIVSNKRNIKNKKPLWEKPKSGNNNGTISSGGDESTTDSQHIPGYEPPLSNSGSSPPPLSTLPSEKSSSLAENDEETTPPPFNSLRT